MLCVVFSFRLVFGARCLSWGDVGCGVMLVVVWYCFVHNVLRFFCCALLFVVVWGCLGLFGFVCCFLLFFVCVVCCCVLFVVVRCSLFVVCCLLLMIVVCLLFVACYLLVVVSCSLFWLMLFVRCCPFVR